MEESTESTTPRLYGDPCHLYGHIYSHFLHAQRKGSKADTSTPKSRSKTSSTQSKSMLVTGFGMRNVESLQRALLDDEQQRQLLLSKYPVPEEYECTSVASETSSKLTKSTSMSFTQLSSGSEPISGKSLELRYLMGLAAPEEEEGEEKAETRKKVPVAEETEKDDERLTLAMRKARKYLKDHRIFEFFQFLIAHMLSELPDNPIQFLIDLLDKCLIYRSGFCQPPLLFEKPHLEQLFYLMDRMRTGFIELKQYETGMKTLGICSYDKNPPLSTDGMVAKETFIEEAYDCLTDIFVDLVRRRGNGKVTPPSLVTPPPTEISVAAMDYVDQ